MTTALDLYAREPLWRTQVSTRLSEPQTLPVYTIATLPDATLWPYAMVAVSDGASNQRQAISDGTIWRYPSGTAV
jgi:hypothetical protein